jgi:hypothetical protein
MEVVVGGRSSIEEADLKVMRLLEKILTILSVITMISDESYNYLLALIGQVTFNVRNFLVSPFCLVL